MHFATFDAMNLLLKDVRTAMTSGRWVLLACTSVFVGCTSGIKVTPVYDNTALVSPCNAPAKFSAKVTRGDHPGPFSLTSTWLLVNGENIPMHGPGGGAIFGDYVYESTVPNDNVVPDQGEVRFRYLFKYTQGSVTGSDHQVYGPQSNYIVLPMASLSWTSPTGHAVLPNDVTNQPRRIVHVGRSTVMTGFTGPVSDSTDLVVTNTYGRPINLGTPTITAPGGGAVAGVMITPQPTSCAVFPVTLANGEQCAFTITTSETFTGAVIHKRARIRFPWYPSPGTPSCSFGPIWVDVKWASQAL